MDTSTIFKSNHSALSYFEQGEGNFGICGDAFIQGPAQCHFQWHICYVCSMMAFIYVVLLCLFNDGFHICYVCSMMHCFCRQIKQWRIDDGRRISICIGGVSAIAIVHMTIAIYLQLPLSNGHITIAIYLQLTLYKSQLPLSILQI